MRNEFLDCGLDAHVEVEIERDTHTHIIAKTIFIYL